MRRLGDVGAAGNNVGCHVIDLSASGAAISIGPDVRLLVGVMVTVGKTQGRVVRHIENGFAVEFTRLQHPDFVEENVTGQSGRRFVNARPHN